MLIKELTKGIDCRFTEPAEPLEETEISELCINSVDCRPGALFFAVKGVHTDGAAYIADAERCGATAYVSEHELKTSVPGIIVNDVREAMALMAANFYYNAHKNLNIIAVVGTNGKTTTAHMIYNLLVAAGERAALFGTLGATIQGQSYPSKLTTPDPIELHRLFQLADFQGVKYVVMEVSAHAIALKKMAGIRAKVAVFTNLSRDHLDFFGDMDSYKKVKVGYFKPEHAEFAVVNADDETGREILASEAIPSASYGMENPSDTFAIDYDYTSKLQCIVNCFDDIFELEAPFVGKFNLYNALAATTTARLIGIKPEVIASAFKHMPEVEGRFNILQSGKRVIIDYAHTPDGLINLLTAAKKLVSRGGKLISVFGCGGDRDRGKRREMGKISTELADFTVITSDNPRSEDPRDIIRDVESGVEGNGNYIVIPDRAGAIAYALLVAKQNDVVVISGKGAENYTEVRGERVRYSDRAEVLESFRRYNL